VADALPCHVGTALVVSDAAETFDDLADGLRLVEPEHVASVLREKTTGCFEALAELERLGDQEGCRAGDVDHSAATVGVVEGADLNRVVIDQSAFDSCGLLRDRSAVLARQPCAAPTGPRCDLFRDDEIDGDDRILFAAACDVSMPDPGFSAEDEPACGHGVPEQRFIGEARGVEHEVGVGGERLIAGQAIDCLEVDGLRSDEDEGVEVRPQR